MTDPSIDGQLSYHDHTDTILLGAEIGSAQTEHGELRVVAAGRIVRFMLDGHDGYVDLDLSEFAGAALAWLAGEREEGER